MRAASSWCPAKTRTPWSILIVTFTGIAFLEIGTPENITAKIDQGVRVIAGHHEEAAKIGRAYQKRAMPV